MLYGDRVVIPAVLTKNLFKDFHIGHMGILRMKALMKSYVCWYGMDKEIINLVRIFKNCALVTKAPPVKFNPWPKTDKPWSRLHIDYAGPIKRTYYFVLVDSFTKWLEVVKCKTPTSIVTIDFFIRIIHQIRLTRNYHVQ